MTGQGNRTSQTTIADALNSTANVPVKKRPGVVQVATSYGYNQGRNQDFAKGLENEKFLMTSPKRRHN